MFKPGGKEKENEQLAEELSADVIEELLADEDLVNTLLKLMDEQITEESSTDIIEELLVDDNKLNVLLESIKVLFRYLQLAKVETDAQTYLEKNYPTPDNKVKCMFLDISNGLKKKLTDSLDLAGFSNLRLLVCNEQNVTSLSILDCLQLEGLSCWGNKLTELNLRNCFQLKKLGCSGNGLTNLDLSNCEKLEILDCSKNQLAQLDLRQNKKLTELYCYENNLTNLEIKCPNLTNAEMLEKSNFYFKPY